MCARMYVIFTAAKRICISALFLSEKHNCYVTRVLNDMKGNKNYSQRYVGDAIYICNKHSRHLIPVIYQTACDSLHLSHGLQLKNTYD